LNILQQFQGKLPDGRKIDVAPIVETLVEETYGPRLGSKIIVDNRDQLSVEPNKENEILGTGERLPIHELDDDDKHLQVHLPLAQAGDPTGVFRLHIQDHMRQKQTKQQAQAAQQQQQGGGGGAPRPGAQPQPIRGGQNPAGAIHPDKMSGSDMMPRKAG
jgi:hypothetical protein